MSFLALRSWHLRRKWISVSLSGIFRSKRFQIKAKTTLPLLSTTLFCKGTSRTPALQTEFQVKKYLEFAKDCGYIILPNDHEGLLVQQISMFLSAEWPDVPGETLGNVYDAGDMGKIKPGAVGLAHGSYGQSSSNAEFSGIGLNQCLRLCWKKDISAYWTTVLSGALGIEPLRDTLNDFGVSISLLSKDKASFETRLTRKNFQDMSQDSESDQNRRFLTEYITYAGAYRVLARKAELPILLPLSRGKECHISWDRLCRVGRCWGRHGSRLGGAFCGRVLPLWEVAVRCW